ncbi:hypothetical protein F0237_21960 [Vibrio tubiashii]|uniref:Uncharacterized protein n=1 Tax=Vibrio tubiashii TaxID=29498 RepID=A0AAE5GU98_9VIBR|nr:hypothetical protein [Vibrio tubiashii]NOI83328.1 hypothetical protein [Vibrio tubiashii]
MKSFLDDLLEFGAGALDSVGEHADWLFGKTDQSSNPNTTQQPNHPRLDNAGNVVTRPMGSLAGGSSMLWVVGGGFGVLALLLIAMMAFKK